jgi:tRNA (cytidine/uridine-2'-O-)-methyltransferase
VHPLGFDLEERSLRRAGLDYREFAHVEEHASLAACLSRLGIAWPREMQAPYNADTTGTPREPDADGAPPPRLYAFSTRGRRSYCEARYRPGDALLFGPETSGLPADLLASLPPAERLRLPMMPGSRSINLSNAVAVAVFEAWRQQGFVGGT